MFQRVALALLLKLIRRWRTLLERCDKLLHSIAESPVLVLDSSFYKEEPSPSPIMKRSIDFKGENDGVTSM
ncbi:hypothetical protein GOBAR_DD01895 [Gossypium barbadense]|nr:hypothetical protein GOBAR_DD01895 [Gossypium barbadense]